MEFTVVRVRPRSSFRSDWSTSFAPSRMTRDPLMCARRSVAATSPTCCRPNAPGRVPCGLDLRVGHAHRFDPGSLTRHVCYCPVTVQGWIKVADAAFKATDFQIAYVIVRAVVHRAEASEGEAREQLSRRYLFMLDTIVKPMAKGRKDGPPKMLFVREVLAGAAPEVLGALASKVRAPPPSLLRLRSRRFAAAAPPSPATRDEFGAGLLRGVPGSALVGAARAGTRCGAGREVDCGRVAGANRQGGEHVQLGRQRVPACYARHDCGTAPARGSE